MLPLLRFLQERKNLLLFLLLEAIAFYLVVRFNDPHRHAFGDAMLGANVKVHRTMSGVTRYFDLGKSNLQLQKENDSLRQEVQRLHQRAYLHQLKFADIPDWGHDTLDTGVDSLIKYIPCRAIQYTTDRPYNYITLDKGSRDGIVADMGLLSPQGIAGRVVKVGESFCVALSTLNGAFKAAAQTEQGYSGAVFEWKGGNIKIGYLTGVPTNVSVEPGEGVYTAAHSLIFPEKFPIGTVASVEDDPQAPGFYAIEVALATDFANLDHLYLIDATYRNQVDTLQQDLIQ